MKRGREFYIASERKFNIKLAILDYWKTELTSIQHSTAEFAEPCRNVKTGGND